MVIIRQSIMTFSQKETWWWFNKKIFRINQNLQFRHLVKVCTWGLTSNSREEINKLWCLLMIRIVLLSPIKKISKFFKTIWKNRWVSCQRKFQNSMSSQVIWILQTSSNLKWWQLNKIWSMDLVSRWGLKACHRGTNKTQIMHRKRNIAREPDLLIKILKINRKNN